MSMSKPKLFYTYLHRRHSDGTIFYIGKGKAGRAWWFHDRSPKWRSTHKKHGTKVEIVQRFTTEKEAFTHEMQLITACRLLGERLVNLTNGGEGVSGYSPTLEQRETASAHRKLLWKSDVYREKHRQAMKLAMSSAIYKATIATRSKAMWAQPGFRERRNQPRGPEMHNARAVACLETKVTFGSQSLAVAWLRSIGFSSATGTGISFCCSKTMHSYCGYHWHYADQSPTPADLEWMLLGYAKGSQHYRARQVTCVETGEIFPTQTDAARWLATTTSTKESPSSVSACCSFSSRHSLGYHFHFTDTPPTTEQMAWMFEGRPSGARAYNAVRIECVETGQVFETGTAAMKWVRETTNPRAQVSNILNHCKHGVPKTAYGHHWRYV